MSLSERFAKINPHPPVSAPAKEPLFSKPKNQNTINYQIENDGDEYEEVEYEEGVEYEEEEEAENYPNHNGYIRNYKRSGNTQKGPNSCFNCGGVGHFARECPSQRNNQRVGGKVRTYSNQRQQPYNNNRGRNFHRKDKSPSNLDSELDNYWKKAPNSSKLDSELDDYWKQSKKN